MIYTYIFITNFIAVSFMSQELLKNVAKCRSGHCVTIVVATRIAKRTFFVQLMPGISFVQRQQLFLMSIRRCRATYIAMCIMKLTSRCMFRNMFQHVWGPLGLPVGMRKLYS